MNVEVPLWMIITGGLVSFLFGGSGLVFGIIAFVKAVPERTKIQREADKIKIDKEQMIITGTIDISGKLLGQLGELLEVAKNLRAELEQVRSERDDCFDKLNRRK